MLWAQSVQLGLPASIHVDGNAESPRTVLHSALGLLQSGFEITANPIDSAVNHVRFGRWLIAQFHHESPRGGILQYALSTAPRPHIRTTGRLENLAYNKNSGKYSGVIYGKCHAPCAGNLHF